MEKLNQAIQNVIEKFCITKSTKETAEKYIGQFLDEVTEEVLIKSISENTAKRLTDLKELESKAEYTIKCLKGHLNALDPDLIDPEINNILTLNNSLINAYRNNFSLSEPKTQVAALSATSYIVWAYLESRLETRIARRNDVIKVED